MILRDDRQAIQTSTKPGGNNGCRALRSTSAASSSIPYPSSHRTSASSVRLKRPSQAAKQSFNLSRLAFRKLNFTGWQGSSCRIFGWQAGESTLAYRW